MSKMNPVTRLRNAVDNKTAATVNLLQFETIHMNCPVTKTRKCHFIPLKMIDGLKHNPMRPAGTLPAAVATLFESLITSDAGQEEPICLEWDSSIGKFVIVFGCHREWATEDAYTKGYTIANHPPGGVPGIWAWVFTDSDAECTRLQMRENGNKKPHLPGTKDEMVKMLRRYIHQGGLDTGYPSVFASLGDKEKYERARGFMKSNTPFWGGRKFKGVWNKLSQSGGALLSLDFKTFSKAKMVEYFCAHNPYGICREDMKTKDPSGSVIEIGGKKYAIYFVNAKSEIHGALPTNASRCKWRNSIDHMIVVAALNDSTDMGIGGARETFEVLAKEWNQNIYRAFDEVFWMPQTKSENSKHILSGTWVSQNSL